MVERLDTLRTEAVLDASRWEAGARQMAASAEQVAAGVAKAGDAVVVVERRVVESASAFDRLQRNIDPAVAASQRLEAAQRTLARAVEQGRTTQDEANRLLDLARQRYESSATAVQRYGAAHEVATTGASRFGSVIGQAGFQIQDFAVQVQSGTSALTALSQQGSQLLGVFGTGGAIAGAVLAVGVLAAKFLDVGSATEEAKRASESYRDSVKTLNDLLETAWQKTVRLNKERIDTLVTRESGVIGQTERQGEVVAARISDLEAELATAEARRAAPLGTGLISRNRNVNLDAYIAYLQRQLESLRGESARLGQARAASQELIDRARSFNPDPTVYEYGGAGQMLFPQDAVDSAFERARRSAASGGSARSARTSAQRLGYGDASIYEDGSGTVFPVGAVEPALARMRDEQEKADARRAAASLKSIDDEEKRRQQSFDRTIERYSYDLSRGTVDALFEGTRNGQDAFRRLASMFTSTLKNALASALDVNVFRPFLGDTARLLGFGGGGGTGTASGGAGGIVAAASGGNLADVALPAAAVAMVSGGADLSNLISIPAGASIQQVQRLTNAAKQGLDPTDPAYTDKIQALNNLFIRRLGGNPQSVNGEQSLSTAGVLPDVIVTASPVGSLTGAAQLVSSSGGGNGLLSGLGLSNIGSTVSGWLGSPILGSSALSSATTTQLTALEGVGLLGPAAPASLGVAGVTFGSALGGAGLGFGAGMLTSNLVGNARGTIGPGGTIGAAGGALAGTALGIALTPVLGPAGPLIGGLIGGAAGGAGGALFGPTKAGMASRSGGDVGYGIGPDGRLIITGSGGNRWNAGESIAAVQQQLDAINAAAAQRGLMLDTAGGVVGFGAASSNPREINLAGIQVSAPNGSATIQQALAGAAGRGPQAAFEAVDWVRNVFEKLTQSDRVSSFKKAMDDLNQTFGDAIAKARELGVSESDLVTERDRRRAQLEADRSDKLGAIDSNLAARMARARGDDAGATLLAFDATAQEERKSLVKQFFDLGLEGTKDANDRIATLEQTLAAERLKIVTDFANQTAATEKAAADQRAQVLAQQAAAEQQRLQTARGLFEDLTIGGLGGLSPEARYFSGVSALNAARQTVLGDPSQANLSDFVRLSQSVLPVARDYLGTSERYAGIVADVASTLRTVAPGSDPANLGALLEAQASGTDRIETAILATGNANAESLQAIANELRKLTAQNEALLRRVA